MVESTQPPPKPKTPPKQQHQQQQPSSTHSGKISSSDSTTAPTGFRPGRLSNLEILERVFPLQRKSVLELVLQGCNGDLVKAIEHFLSAQDTLLAQQHAVLHGRSEPRFAPYVNASSPFRPMNGTNKIAYGGLKSAFTPLTPTTSLNGIHSAFSPQATAGFTPDALRAPFFQHPSRSELLTAAPHFGYASLGAIPTSLHGNFSVSSPFFLNPYRPMALSTSPPRTRTPDKGSEKSPMTDSDRASDGWDDRDLKDTD